MLGQKIKGQPSSDFLVASSFSRDILTHLDQVFPALKHIQDDERKTLRTF